MLPPPKVHSSQAALKRFGQNPHAEDLYRIVWAPSRRIMGCGEDGARFVVKYPEAGAHWIMERWMTPWEYAGVVPEVWNMTMTILGPYPERGEYECCHVFDRVNVENSNLEKLISWIEAGRKFRPIENDLALRESMQREIVARSAMNFDRAHEALPAFGTAAVSGRGGGSGTKTKEPLKSANELGLPTSAGIMTGKPSKKFKVMVQL